MGSSVGRSLRRVDAVEKVTGRARFVGDLALPGMLWARVLRSPHAHARIGRLDTAAAAALPGVACVLTGADLTGCDPFYGPALKDQPILASDEVRCEGDPVVAVAAVDEATAEAALERVDVAYEPLPAVTSLEEALAEGAPLVHPEGVRPAGHFRDLAAVGAGRSGNVVHEFHYARGDPQEALEAAGDLCFDDTYSYPMVFHYALEPYGCIADWQGDRVVVHSATQHPFAVRKEIAEVFGLGFAAVRVVVPYIGGAFGSKSYTKVEPLAVALSRRCGRPVRLCLSVEEAFRTGRKPGARVRLRTAVTPDGRITARHLEVWYLLGAYADVGPRVTQKAGYTALGPYRIPHARVDAYGVYTHTAPAVAYRGYGVPQVALAYESQLNRIAAHLGLDPVELRLRNLLRRGEPYAEGDTPLDADLADDLRQVVERLGWERSPEPGRGRGVAVSLKAPLAPSVSNATVRLHVDGTAQLYTSAVEIGQGARTALGQMVAEELGLPFDRVEVVLADTGVTPYDQATSSSRTTTLNGLACVAAAADVRRQLQSIAAEAWGLWSEDVTCADGELRAGGRRMTFAEAVTAAYGMPGGELIGVGTYRGPTGDVPLRGITPFWEVGLVAAEVEVDAETGHVRVRRLVSGADIGRAINPALAEGQDEGAVMMGLGHALMEEMAYRDGQLMNGSPALYPVPVASDLPDELESLLIENGDGPGPFGAKGLGESATTVTAPAVAAAVADATGCQQRQLPLLPERVWRALRDRDGAGAAGRPAPVPAAAPALSGAPAGVRGESGRPEAGG